MLHFPERFRPSAPFPEAADADNFFSSLPKADILNFSLVLFYVRMVSNSQFFIMSVPGGTRVTVYLASSSTYRLTPPTFLYAGRMILGSTLSSSILWAHQPGSLAMAKIGVKSSWGMPSIVYTKPE